MLKMLDLRNTKIKLDSVDAYYADSCINHASNTANKTIRIVVSGVDLELKYAAEKARDLDLAKLDQLTADEFYMPPNIAVPSDSAEEV